VKPSQRRNRKHAEHCYDNQRCLSNSFQTEHDISISIRVTRAKSVWRRLSSADIFLESSLILGSLNLTVGKPFALDEPDVCNMKNGSLRPSSGVFSYMSVPWSGCCCCCIIADNATSICAFNFWLWPAGKLSAHQYAFC
jgi:hypothetical protein